MRTLHVAEMISYGGREGVAESPDGNFSVTLRAAETGEVTPEHLFAAAYAACFHSALKRAAERVQSELTDSSVTARFPLIEGDDGGYELSVELRAHLPGIPEREAMQLLEEANRTCPYSKAVQGNVDVVLALN